MPLGPSDFTLVGQSINNHNASLAAHADIRALIPMPSKSLSDYANVIVVDAGGNGDYTTQAAAAAAITNDDASHVYNVFVFGETINWSVWNGRPFIKVHGRGCKIYKALLTQSGTNAPSATVLENTIGNIAWTRSSAGQYVATLTGAFPSGKVLFFIGTPSAAAAFAKFFAARGSDNTVTLKTYNMGDYETPTSTELNDGLLQSVPILIEVYP